MANETLLVIGIHRDELAFGERVATLVEPAHVDVLRIPHGIDQPRRGPGERFHSRTEHREIYLQLLQEVKGRYRRLIDLHHGFDPSGLSADVYCHDEAYLARLAARLDGRAAAQRVRLVRIASRGERDAGGGGAGVADAVAATWIPDRVWRGRAPLYVGVEVYLPLERGQDGAGRAFAGELIEAIRAC
jgi:hypothetical protein